MASADHETDQAVRRFQTELGPDARPTNDEPVSVDGAPPIAPGEMDPPASDTAAAGASAASSTGEPSLDDLIGGNRDREAADLNSTPAADATVLPVAEAPPLAPSADDETLRPAPDHDIETIARRKPTRRPARRRKPKSRWPLVIVGLVAALAGLLVWRGALVQQAPQLASLYAAIGLPVNVRGLTFHEVKTTKDVHDGVPVLVVEGKVINSTGAAVDVPRLRFAVQDLGGKEIYTWTAQPSQPSLAGGETLPFRSRLAAPPAEGHSVLVRFFNKHDATPGAQ